MCEECGLPVKRRTNKTCSKVCDYKRRSRTLKGRTLNTGRTHIKKGSTPANFKGWWKTKKGYVIEYMPGHPMASSKGYVRQHRRVLADKLGRILDKHEDVHHINHKRDDNRPANLELMTHQAHSKLHHVDRLRGLYAAKI